MEKAAAGNGLSESFVADDVDCDDDPVHTASGLVPTLVQPPPGFSESELDRRFTAIRTRLSAPPRAPSKEAGAGQLVEAIRQATEVLVWGERHDSSLFDLFCEHQMLAAFISALRLASTPVAVKVQVLQTISILVQNARRATSFFFLLSGGLLNALFSEPPDLDEEEILTYFVAFLKSLALRLDVGSARLCLAAVAESSSDGDAQATSPGGRSLKRLPIFECGSKLVGHRDPMVRTAAQTALLSILRLEDPLVQEVATSAAQRLLAPSLTAIVWATHAVARRSEDLNSAKLQDAIEDLEDWFGFVGDLFGLNIPELSAALERQGFGTEHGRGILLPTGSCGTKEEPQRQPFDKDRGEEVASPVAFSAVLAASRLECVLQYHSEREGLPFPFELHAHENMATILARVATGQVREKEFRRTIVSSILATFAPEELCIDMDARASGDLLAKLERHLEARLSKSKGHDVLDLRTSAGLATVKKVLRNVVSHFHSVCSGVTATTAPGSLDSSQRSQQPLILAGGWPVRIEQPQASVGVGKRYHIYTYTLISDTPFEKLSTSSFKKASASLDYHTRLGRSVVMYDQQTGRSLYNREKRGSPYIAKAIRLAQSTYPILPQLAGEA